jgi:hypothetical protein
VVNAARDFIAGHPERRAGGKVGVVESKDPGEQSAMIIREATGFFDSAACHPPQRHIRHAAPLRMTARN